MKKEENRIREWDLMNYNLGKYIGIAVNDPKKYPRQPFLKKNEPVKKVMTSEEMEAIMRRNTIILGGKINKK